MSQAANHPTNAQALEKNTAGGVVPYEQRLDQDLRWALNQGGLHFERESEVQKALYRIAKRLDELKIPYALAGAMALFQHGYRRFTEDVDILVTKDALQRIHAELDGLGYVTPFSKSKNLRDTQAGVRIEFLITGGYPGDGKPKPVAFPDPAQVSVEIEGVRVITLPKLIELKLASGMTGPGRRKDLGDVQEVIKFLRLPLQFADQLAPYVQPTFKELWREAAEGRVSEAENEGLA